VTLHLLVHQRGGFLQRAAAQIIDVPKNNNPPPLKPADGSFEPGKEHSVLLTSFHDGRTLDIKFLSALTESEVLQAVNAFRNWRLKAPKKQKPDVHHTVVTYAYAEESNEAAILNVEPQESPRPPRPLSRENPVYPDYLRKERVSGTVVLMFVIDEKGSVRSIRVVKSDHPGLSASAATAISKWKFEPAKVEGMPVMSRVRLPVPFKFNR
jgi:TonB family protein